MNDIVAIIEVMLFIVIAAICSGLNVSLMSLPIADLKRQVALGENRAKRILPFRVNSHLTLSSILLVNVAAVSASTLVLEERAGGLIAGVGTTLLMVIFGEVLPQAWFTRFAFRFCSTLAPVMRLMVILTYPIAKPLQLILDKMIGHEGIRLHSRDELGLIVSEHLTGETSELDENEVEIMRGALKLSEKRVRDIVTPLEDVYYLTPDMEIDSAKINEIKTENRSRIPVINQAKTKCYGVLLMKDMVDVDFDEKPVKVSDLKLHKTRMVGSMTALDTMFRKFISARSHLIPVSEDDHIVGIITIEDLIEEIIGQEIEDEADQLRDD